MAFEFNIHIQRAPLFTYVNRHFEILYDIEKDRNHIHLAMLYNPFRNKQIGTKNVSPLRDGEMRPF